MIVLRPATRSDVPLLAEWARRPHVVRATSDDPSATEAFEGADWSDEVDRRDELGADVWEVLVAELDGHPIGMIQITDPHREPDHYWGEVEPNLRAIDIWIGEPDLLGQGHGTEMLRQAIDRCFADPTVDAIVIDPLASNTDAVRFYRRLGFVDVGERRFSDGDDLCLVMRLERPRVLSASRVIGAPAETIFEFVADPAAHAGWDANDNVAVAAPGQRILAVGDVFVTELTQGSIRENHVVEFEEARVVAWCPAGAGHPPAGHLWRWQFEPRSDGSTKVTHGYEWTNLADPARLERARSTTTAMLAASLARLGELIERQQIAGIGRMGGSARGSSGQCVPEVLA